MRGTTIFNGFCDLNGLSGNQYHNAVLYDIFLVNILCFVYCGMMLPLSAAVIPLLFCNFDPLNFGLYIKGSILFDQAHVLSHYSGQLIIIITLEEI
jgi:hypothetical protein